MNNLELASVFNRIAALSELKGENVFVVRAYQRAAQAIQYFPVEVEQYVREGKDLKEISGIGDAISQKIHELPGNRPFAVLRGAEGGVPQWAY